MAAPPLPDDIERAVMRELKRAASKALRKLGAKAVRQRKADLRRALDSVSKRRLAAVRVYRGRYGGQVIIADHFAGAEVQDTGGVIRAKGSLGLAVGRSGSRLGREKTFLQPRPGKPTLIRAKKGGQVVAAFLPQVRVGRIRVGFEDSMEKIAQEFDAEFERALINGR